METTRTLTNDISIVSSLEEIISTKEGVALMVAPDADFQDEFKNVYVEVDGKSYFLFSIDTNSQTVFIEQEPSMEVVNDVANALFGVSISFSYYENMIEAIRVKVENYLNREEKTSERSDGQWLKISSDKTELFVKVKSGKTSDHTKVLRNKLVGAVGSNGGCRELKAMVSQRLKEQANLSYSADNPSRWDAFLNIKSRLDADKSFRVIPVKPPTTAELSQEFGFPVFGSI